MANLFGDYKTEGLEESQDRLGGGFGAIDSDIYTGTIKALFMGESSGGAKNLTLIVDLGNNKEYKETIYFTDKKGKHYFVKDGKKQSLPGFTTVNDICLIATSKELFEQDAEEKTVKLYDFEQKKELPKAVQMLTETLGQKISLGIVKILENKQKKNEVTKEYEPTAETREINQIDKVFHPELKVTVVEARNEKPSEFWDAWLEKNKGQTKDKRTIKDGQAPAGGGAPKASGGKPAPAAGDKPKRSLFDKKG